MAFIYSRAQAVLIWLGRLIYPQHVTVSYNTQLERLRHVEYWRRVWIVQEIGLARKISFFYEFRNQTVVIEWQHFMSTLEDMASHENDDAEAVLPLKLKKHREGRHGDINKLEQLLETFAYTDCQEPRDKIYGFMGLAHDCQNGPLKVNYSISLLDLYKEVVAF